MNAHQRRINQRAILRANPDLVKHGRKFAVRDYQKCAVYVQQFGRATRPLPASIPSLREALNSVRGRLKAMNCAAKAVHHTAFGRAIHGTVDSRGRVTFSLDGKRMSIDSIIAELGE